MTSYVGSDFSSGILNSCDWPRFKTFFVSFNTDRYQRCKFPFRKRSLPVLRAGVVAIWGAGVAQWWEHSPPTNVARVRFPVSASYVGCICCWFSSLLREVFLRVLRFSPLRKNQHFPNSNSIRIQWTTRATMWMSTVEPDYYYILLLL